MTRAARLVRHGSPLEVQDVDIGEPGADEVQVELRYAGVNPVDRYTADGAVAPDGPLPRTLGGEASGFLDGTPVLVCGGGLGARRDGVWAGAAVVPRATVYELPAGVDLREAAAMGIAGLTAWNVVALGGVGGGDRVLVLGASGGVGLPVVSLVASLGAQVWGQTGHADKVDAVRAMGAGEVVVADAAGLHEAVAGLRPTVVIDPLGGAFTAAALGAMAPHGRLVLYGTSAGTDAGLNLRHIYRNGIRILGYAGLMQTEAERREGLSGALAALADGRLRIPIDRELRLEQVGEAFALLEGRAVTGKVILATA